MILRKQFYFFQLLTLVFFSAACSSCNSDRWRGKIDEGVIQYEVTYPYFTKEGFMASMMPDEALLRFKNDKITSEISQGIFKLKFVSDSDKKIYKQQLYFWNKKLATTLSEEETMEYCEERFPKLTIEHTNETDSIAGYLCHKAIAHFYKDSIPSIVLYFTDDIDIKDPNWYSPFQGIDGVLLQYEVEQFGLRTRFKAINVYKEDIENDIFILEEEYKLVNSTVMHEELTDIFSTFLGD